MPPQKLTPRADYRHAEHQRTIESVSLTEKFHNLKSLTVEFGYFSPEGQPRNRQIKYTVNPDNARSVFRLDCMNSECVGGDYNLSDAIARAVAARQTSATGELVCQGWMSKTTIDRVHCHNILRYKLTLAYGARKPKPSKELV